MISSVQSKTPRVMFTSDRCMIRGVAYPGIPLLIDYKNQVVEVASDWLRHLLVRRGEASSSVRQFAYHLKYWWEFLKTSGVQWDRVDDLTMVTWRDKTLKALEGATVNGYISTVFRMYLWAEKNGYVQGLIGEPDFPNKIHPPLSVEVTFDRRGTSKFTSPLLKRTVARPILPTPTHEEITKLHSVLADLCGDNFDLMVRNALILTWAEATGARRKEILSVRVDQIPTWQEIELLEDSQEPGSLIITGKGNKKRSLLVGPDLLIQTREYIDFEREAIVTSRRKRLGSNYREPDQIFLSSTTGKRLQADTVSQTFAIAFRRAVVRGSIHRIRARFITDGVENAAERELERFGTIPDATSVLLPIAQATGHTNPITLFPYLAAGRKRLLRQTKAERTAVLEERSVGAERRSGTNLLRLRSSVAALNLVRALSSGNKRRIRKRLEDLFEDYGLTGSQLTSLSVAAARKKGSA